MFGVPWTTWLRWEAIGLTTATLFAWVLTVTTAHMGYLYFWWIETAGCAVIFPPVRYVMERLYSDDDDDEDD